MNSPIPPLAALYDELASAQIALAALHREAVLDLYRALDPDAQREIQNVAEEKKRLAERVLDPIDRSAHQAAADRIDQQIHLFTKLREGQ